MILNKKYYDGFNVVDILFKNLEPKKMLKVLEAFSECDGVDAVEVVRCKDCTYYRQYADGRYDCDNLYGMADAYEDGFCSRAERRKDNG